MSKTTSELVDEWATETLERLIVSVHTALMDKPPELPDYLESEIESMGIRARIRVDFYEDHETLNGTPRFSGNPISLDAWKTLNKEWERDGIKFVVGLCTAMLVLGVLLYWFLVIAK